MSLYRVDVRGIGSRLPVAEGLEVRLPGRPNSSDRRRGATSFAGVKYFRALGYPQPCVCEGRMDDRDSILRSSTGGL